MKQRPVLSKGDACVGKADGWGERACAAALTVGLIFWILFYQEKSIVGKSLRVFQEFCVTLQFYYTENYAKTPILHHRVGLQRGSGSAALSPRGIRSDGQSQRHRRF